MSKRDIGKQLLQTYHIPVEYEEIVFTSTSPYEDTIRKLLRGMSLQKALGIVEVPDSVTKCRCGSYKFLRPNPGM